MRIHRRVGRAVLAAFALLLMASIIPGPADATSSSGSQGTIVVANRASGDLSLIDVATDAETRLALPAAENPSEPMYVVAVRARVFVGDRANDRVVAFDRRTWEPIGEAPTGEGVFHMWADPTGRQLWVNNDVDNTMTVIDPRTLRVRATVDLPADLVAAGGKPHDVILDRRSAFVTVVGLPGDNDAIVRFGLGAFRELARADVGKDPHVTLDPSSRRIYVASQDADEVVVLAKSDLREVRQIDIPAAHGIDITRNGRVVYTTNITGGGTDAIYAINTRTNQVIGEPVDADFAVPHNLVLDGRNRKLYLTHSGATADKVSVYTVSGNDPTPVLIGDVTVGLNPFGLEFVR